MKEFDRQLQSYMRHLEEIEAEEERRAGMRSLAGGQPEAAVSELLLRLEEREPSTPQQDKTVMQLTPRRGYPDRVASLSPTPQLILMPSPKKHFRELLMQPCVRRLYPLGHLEDRINTLVTTCGGGAVAPPPVSTAAYLS